MTTPPSFLLNPKLFFYSFFFCSFSADILSLPKMSLPHMAFLVQPRPIHRSSCVHLWPNLHNMMDYIDDQVITCRHTLPLKCSTIPFAISSYAAKRYSVRELDKDEAGQVKDIEIHSKPSFGSNLHDKEGSGELGKLNYHNFEAVSMYELRETLRRRRIGMANKGKVPWNKGRKHTPETCARIKERTLEAMRDPKIRRKMSETPRTHSEQSKKKIGSSLKQLWAKRLNLKRSKEKFYFSWAESIAEAARKGGTNEEQLNWDSYDMLKEEITCLRHKQYEEKVKEKEKEKVIKRIQAVKRTPGNKLNPNKGGPRGRKNVTRSSKTRKKELKISSELSLKSSLTKIEETKSINRTQTGVMSSLHSALEKFDIESIKEEQKRKTVSLADQIQAAKSRRQRTSNANPE